MWLSNLYLLPLVLDFGLDFFSLDRRRNTPEQLFPASTVLQCCPGRVGLKSDGTTGQKTGHLAAGGSASRYMARRKATRQATELTTV